MLLQDFTILLMTTSNRTGKDLVMLMDKHSLMPLLMSTHMTCSSNENEIGNKKQHVMVEDIK
jgi:hypothetical protein